MVDVTLDGLQGAGQVDIIHVIGLPIPAKVIAYMLGVPPADVDSFKRWTSAVSRVPAWTGDLDENVAAAYDGVVSLYGYFRDIIAFRRRACSAPWSRPNRTASSSASTNSWPVVRCCCWPGMRPASI